MAKNFLGQGLDHTHKDQFENTSPTSELNKLDQHSGEEVSNKSNVEFNHTLVFIQFHADRNVDNGHAEDAYQQNGSNAVNSWQTSA